MCGAKPASGVRVALWDEGDYMIFALFGVLVRVLRMKKSYFMSLKSNCPKFKNKKVGVNCPNPNPH
jgi:hypothetical protein